MASRAGIGMMMHAVGGPQRQNRSTVLAAAFVGCAAAAVRVPTALHRPLWQDEVASARAILQPTFGHMLSQVRVAESTPPAWYAIAWGLHRAGASMVGLRFLSVGFTAVLAALVVVAAARLLPRWAAVLAGLTTALGWQFVFHGSELRAYALAALLALVFALTLEWAAASPSLGRLAALAGCTALACLTHYFLVLTVIGGLLWVIAGSVERAAKLRVAAALAAGLAPLALWLPALLAQYGNQRFAWIGPFDPLKVAYVYSGMFDQVGPLYAVHSSLGLPAPQIALRLGVLALCLAGFAVLWRSGRRGRLWASLGTAPVLLAALAWLAGARVFDARNLIVVGPFAAIAACALIARLPRSVRPVAAVTVAGLAILGLVLQRPFTPPYDRVATVLVAEGWRPGDRVLVLGDATAIRSPLEWYLGEDLARQTRISATPARELFFVGEGWRRRRTRLLLAQVEDRDLVSPFLIGRLETGSLAARLARRGHGILIDPRPIPPGLHEA